MPPLPSSTAGSPDWIWSEPTDCVGAANTAPSVERDTAVVPPAIDTFAPYGTSAVPPSVTLAGSITATRPCSTSSTSMPSWRTLNGCEPAMRPALSSSMAGL